MIRNSIDIIVNSNSMSAININAKGMGYVPKSYGKYPLTSVNQFIILYFSIKKNWSNMNINKIYFIHSLPLNAIDKRILSKLDIIILYKPTLSKHKALLHSSREHSYLIPSDADYKLILDTDMIAIKEPNLDFSHDVMATYEPNQWDYKVWQELCNACKCKLPNYNIRKETKQSSIYTQYYANPNTPKAFPYFNNGAVLIKSSISNEIGKKYVYYTDEIRKKTAHYAAQMAIGLAINEVTDNWGILPRGFNYLATLEQYTKFNINDITLFHYLGKSGGINLHRYDSYFREAFKKINEL